MTARLLLPAFLIPLLVLVASAAPSSSDIAPTHGVVTNQVIHIFQFQVPQYDTNSVMTSMLRGREADIFPPDRITKITDLVIEFYKYTPTNRLVDVRVTSPECYYHPDKGVGVSDKPIRISRDNMVITGSNYVFDSKSQRMQINHDARVVLMGVRSTKLTEGLQKK